MSQIQILAPNSGSPIGDVIGPASSTDNAITRFNGTTGKLIQNSGVIIDDSDNVTGVTSLNIDGATGNTLVVDTNTFVVDATNNRVGIGQASPTAALHLKAGTAAANTAPLKLTSGTNLTAPEPGAVEYNGTNLFYTDGGSTRRTLNISSADVVGPGSATDNALVRFDGTTGKIIQNSGVIVDDSNNITGVNSLNISGTTGNTLIVDTDTLVVDATNNRVGIGQASPTAALHLKAGTAAANTAPLKLTSGTNLTAPEPGAVEYNGTNLFYTDGGSTRRTLNISSADVVGPGSATDNALVRFDGTTGKIIQNSGVIIDDSNNMTGVNSLNINGATGNTLVVDTDTLVVDATNNRVGIGQASPTAALHLKAGTAAANTAPLKLTSGTNLTAPEPGAVEYNGTNLFYTDGGSNRRTLNISSADVVGPGSATDNALVRFDATTGKIIQNSGVIVDDSNNMTGVNSLNINGATGNTLVVDTSTFVVDATNNRVGVGTAAPDTTLHIVGTTGQKFKGVAAYTGSEDFKLQAAAQTTNATVTDLISIALAEGDMVSIQARVNGFQSDFTDAISAWVYAAARRGTGGNVTLVGTPVINLLESDANTDVTVLADTSGQNLKIQVTGVAAQTWNWVATYNYHKVLTNS